MNGNDSAAVQPHGRPDYLTRARKPFIQHKKNKFEVSKCGINFFSIEADRRDLEVVRKKLFNFYLFQD